MAVFKFSNVGGFGTYQRYNDFLAGNPAVIPDKGSMYPLGVFTLSSGQNEIEFTNIPQTYTHLQVRGVVNTNFGSVDNIYLRFNSDTAGNYSWHALNGNGSSASTASGTSTSSILISRIAGTGTNMSGFVLDILDYRNTNKTKTTRSLSGFDNNGSGELWYWSGNWRKSPIEAVTSFKISAQWGGATQLIANSSFALYGVQA